MPLYGVPSIDLGDGHKLSRVHDREKNLVGFVDAHPDARNPAKQCGGSVPLERSRWSRPDATWRMTGEWPEVTLEPSLLCTACGDHGFVRAGRWVKA